MGMGIKSMPCHIDLPCAHRVTPSGHDFLCGFRVAGTVEGCPIRRRYLGLEKEEDDQLSDGQDQIYPRHTQAQ